MIIDDTNRKQLASYLADYLAVEMEREDEPCLTDVMEEGLDAYESINQPKQYAIASGSLRINLNGQQFLLSDNKKVGLFDSIEEAKEHAHSIGITEEDFENATFNICEYLPESGDYVVI